MQPQKCKLQIWDTAGGEQIRSLTHIYYKDASAVCLCYDSTSEESYDSLSYWADELRSKSDNDNIIMAMLPPRLIGSTGQRSLLRQPRHTRRV